MSPPPRFLQIEAGSVDADVLLSSFRFSSFSVTVKQQQFQLFFNVAQKTERDSGPAGGAVGTGGSCCLGDNFTDT